MTTKTESQNFKALKEFSERFDNWQSLLTGLGTARDKATSYNYAPDVEIQDEEALNMYSDDLVRRICDTYPEESIRKGFTMKHEDGTPAEEVQKALDRIKAFSKLVDAMIWGNVLGGSALIYGISDGNELLDIPLDTEHIQSFTHVNVVDKRYIAPIEWYTDPADINYGKPKLVTITDSVGGFSAHAGTIVHTSRMLMVGGLRTPVDVKQNRGGWDISLLQSIYSTLRLFYTGWGTLGTLLADGDQAVFRMAGLIDALAEGDEGVIQRRMAMLDMSRSVVRALILDADTESYERNQFNYGSLEVPLDMLMYRLSAATKIPVAILMGRSPAGMNATGDSDFEAYYNAVTSYQELTMKPHLIELGNLMAKALKAPPITDVDFENPKQESEQEKIDKYSAMATADVAYINAGVLTPEEVALSRFGGSTWSSHTSIEGATREANYDETVTKAIEQSKEKTIETPENAGTEVS